MGNGKLLLSLNGTERFKLFILRSSDGERHRALKFLEEEGISILNLGRALSKEIQRLNSPEHLEIKAAEMVADLADASSTLSESGCRIIALSNYGILLEPEIGLKAGKILTDLSKRFIVLLLWSGPYADDGKLTWSSGRKNFLIDISSANPQTLDLNHEI